MIHLEQTLPYYENCNFMAFKSLTISHLIFSL